MKIGDWDALHHRVLRGCAEERCKAAVRVNNIDIAICADAPARMARALGGGSWSWKRGLLTLPNHETQITSYFK